MKASYSIFASCRSCAAVFVGMTLLDVRYAPSRAYFTNRE